jgi:hypothetical protein
MSRWMLWAAGILLCVAALVVLAAGLSSDRISRNALGSVGYIALWHAGFFCFVAAS